MTHAAAPRLYCIQAIRAPVVAVFRRGPSDWSHVGRWDLARDLYEPGAWLRGRIFPRRCDLSPDGRLLVYFAHKPGARWDQGESYVALSRLPWLTALHAFGTCGTWSRGYHFTEDGGPDEFTQKRLPMEWRLRPTRPEQFATERRHGWVEAPDSPRRDPKDAWDEQRKARLQKPQPRGHLVLRMESLGWASSKPGVDQAVGGLRVRYRMEPDIAPLDDVQWADWDREGRLLVATRGGRLQVRRLGSAGVKVLFDEDLAPLVPDPSPAPDWAQQW